LIDHAQHDSLKGTRDEAERRKAERDRDAAARQARARKERTARCWTKNDRWHLFAEGPLAEGADIQLALERIIETNYLGPSKPKPEREPREPYAFAPPHPPPKPAPTPNTNSSDNSRDVNHNEPNKAPASPAKAAATRQWERPNRMMLIRIDLSALI